jgi:hypothetical protein
LIAGLGAALHETLPDGLDCVISLTLARPREAADQMILFRKKEPGNAMGSAI